MLAWEGAVSAAEQNLGSRRLAAEVAWRQLLDRDWTRTRVMVPAGATIALALVALVLAPGGWQSSAALHTILEAAATLLALLVGAHALVRYYIRPDGVFLIVGVAFVGTGVLDGYHAVVTAEGIVQVMPSEAHDLIPWSWGASRFYLAGMLLLGSGFVGSTSPLLAGLTREQTVYLAGGVFLALCVFIFAVAPLPRAHYPELYFARPQEFVFAFMTLICIGVYRRTLERRQKTFAPWLVASLVLGLVSQAAIMSLSEQPHDARFDLAHLLKLASYACVEIGLLLAMRETFVAAETARRALRRAKLDLERYIHVASHDLKGPLRNIDDLARWVREDLPESAGEEIRRNVHLIQSRAVRLANMLEALREYSSLGRQFGAPAAVDTGRLVRDLWSELGAGSAFEFSTSDRMPTLESPGDMLRTVFAHLIGNAMRHHGGGGGRIRVEAWPLPGEWRFAVTDDGPGIAVDQRRRVFEMFQTLVAKDRFENVGMGLTIVRQALRSVGGRIWIEDAPGGRGASVYFTWPRRLPNVALDGATREEPATGLSRSEQHV